MKGVILDAGEGTRLFPYTTIMPKGLTPVRGKPILEYVLTWLHGWIDETIICILRKFRGQYEYQLARHRVRYVALEEPTSGNAQTLLRAKSLLGEDDFILHFGDILVKPDYDGMLAMHNRLVNKERSYAATLLLVSNFPLDMVAATLDPSGRIKTLREKPLFSQLGLWNWSGVGVFSKAIWEFVNNHNDLAGGVLQDAVSKGRVFAITHDGPWAEIGDVGNLKGAEEIAAQLANGP